MEENPHFPPEITTRILGYTHQPYERILSKYFKSQCEYIEELRISHLDESFPNWRNLPQSALTFYAHQKSLYMLNLIKSGTFGHIDYEPLALIGAQMGSLKIVLWALYSRMINIKAIVERTTEFGHLSLLQEYEYLNLLHYTENLYDIILRKAGEKNDQKIINWALLRAGPKKYHFLAEGAIKGYHLSLFWETLDKLEPPNENLLSALLDQAIMENDLPTIDKLLEYLIDLDYDYYLNLSPDLKTFIYLYHKFEEPGDLTFPDELVIRLGNPFIIWLKKLHITDRYDILYTQLGDLEMLKTINSVNYQEVAKTAIRLGHLNIALWALNEEPGMVLINDETIDKHLGMVNDLLSLKEILTIEKPKIQTREFMRDVSLIALSSLESSNRQVFQWLFNTYKFTNYSNLITSACKQGYWDIVYTLIKKVGNRNTIPVHCIIQKGHIEIIQDLLKRGYNNFYHIAQSAVVSGNLDILRLVINQLNPDHIPRLIKISIEYDNLNLFLWLINTFPQSFSYGANRDLRIIIKRGLFDFLHHQEGIDLTDIFILIFEKLARIENSLLSVAIILNIYQEEITYEFFQFLWYIVKDKFPSLLPVFQSFGERLGYITIE